MKIQDIISTNCYSVKSKRRNSITNAKFSVLDIDNFPRHDGSEWFINSGRTYRTNGIVRRMDMAVIEFGTAISKSSERKSGRESERLRNRGRGTINMVGSKPDHWIRSKSPGMTRRPDVSSRREGRLRILKSGRCCQELWRADVRTVTARLKRKHFLFLLEFSSLHHRTRNATRTRNFFSPKFVAGRENFLKEKKNIYPTRTYLPFYQATLYYH